MKLSKKEKNKNVHLVIFSSKKYNEHSTNIFKECLDQWTSDENRKFLPDNYEMQVSYIYGDSNCLHKVFFVSTTINWLKKHHLDYLIDTEEYSPNRYMSNHQNIFPLIILS